MQDSLKDKKVLMMGLGILGGGVSCARWLHDQGCKLTITDLKSADYLSSSINFLSDIKNDIIWHLDGHTDSDFLGNDLIVINPDVPLKNSYLQLAIKNGKQIENELTLFYKYAICKNSIAVTGTRGKTTTVNWITHFLKSGDHKVVIAGNSSDSPLLKVASETDDSTEVVIEEPSFLLEHLGESGHASQIAVITNLYQDHLNRHGDMENYALTKANIFKNQKENDFLILNKNDTWTEFFLSLKPKAKVLFFSRDELDLDQEGIFCDKHRKIIFKSNSKQEEILDSKIFSDLWGEHNLENFLAAALVALASQVPKEKIIASINSLPQVKFRQEKIYENNVLEIYNDTSATSPEATIAAIDRFTNLDKNLILITGGTDRDLNFEKLATKINEKIKEENLIILKGSSSDKILKLLNLQNIQSFETLEDCVKRAIAQTQAKSEKSIILFSPASKSFEKFKNEFDRGEQFNQITKKYVTNS